MNDGQNGLILQSMSCTNFLTFSEQVLAWYATTFTFLKSDPLYFCVAAFFSRERDLCGSRHPPFSAYP